MGYIVQYNKCGLGCEGLEDIQILVVGPETHVCIVTECIIAIHGHFRVNQGR